MDWEWYQEPNMIHFFIHCLLRANHKANTWKGFNIEPGQFISGRKQLSKETGLSEQVIRTCIKKLKKSKELTSRSTNKNTLFIVENWEKWQVLDGFENESTSNSTSNQPATNQQLTTNKNEKKDKNEKEILLTSKIEDFKKSVDAFSDKYVPEVLEQFKSYWLEMDSKGCEARFQGQRYFDIERRLKSWCKASYTPLAVNNTSYTEEDGSIHDRLAKRSAADAEKMKQINNQKLAKHG